MLVFVYLYVLQGVRRATTPIAAKDQQQLLPTLSSANSSFTAFFFSYLGVCSLLLKWNSVFFAQLSELVRNFDFNRSRGPSCCIPSTPIPLPLDQQIPHTRSTGIVHTDRLSFPFQLFGVQPGSVPSHSLPETPLFRQFSPSQFYEPVIDNQASITAYRTLGNSFYAFSTSQVGNVRRSWSANRASINFVTPTGTDPQLRNQSINTHQHMSVDTYNHPLQQQPLPVATADPRAAVPAAYRHNGHPPLTHAKTAPAPASLPEPIDPDSGLIRCICSISDDDGFTIQCERCYVWQHWVCVRIDKDHLPEHYKCDLCQPRPLDAARAREKQRRRLERVNKQEEKERKRRRGSERGHGRGKSIGSGSSPKDIVPSVKEKEKEPERERKRPRGPSRQHSDPQKTTTSSSGQHSNRGDSPANVDIDEPSRDNVVGLLGNGLGGAYMSEFVPIEKCMVRDSAAALLADSSTALIELSTLPTFPKLIVRVLDLSTATPPTTGSGKSSTPTLYLGAPVYGVFAPGAFASGKYVAEMRGEVTTIADYVADPINQYQVTGRPKPNVVMLREQGVLVDARRCGNEARFLRRGCAPNIILQAVRVAALDEVRYLVVTTAEVKGGAEFVLPWDVDMSVMPRAPGDEICASCGEKGAVCTDAVQLSKHKNKRSRRGTDEALVALFDGDDTTSRKRIKGSSSSPAVDDIGLSAREERKMREALARLERQESATVYTGKKRGPKPKERGEEPDGDRPKSSSRVPARVIRTTQKKKDNAAAAAAAAANLKKPVSAVQDDDDDRLPCKKIWLRRYLAEKAVADERRQQAEAEEQKKREAIEAAELKKREAIKAEERKKREAEEEEKRKVEAAKAQLLSAGKSFFANLSGGALAKKPVPAVSTPLGKPALVKLNGVGTPLVATPGLKTPKTGPMDYFSMPYLKSGPSQTPGSTLVRTPSILGAPTGPAAMSPRTPAPGYQMLVRRDSLPKSVPSPIMPSPEVLSPVQAQPPPKPAAEVPPPSPAPPPEPPRPVSPPRVVKKFSLSDYRKMKEQAALLKQKSEEEQPAVAEGDKKPDATDEVSEKSASVETPAAGVSSVPTATTEPAAAPALVIPTGPAAERTTDPKELVPVPTSASAPSADVNTAPAVDKTSPAEPPAQVSTFLGGSTIHSFLLRLSYGLTVSTRNIGSWLRVRQASLFSFGSNFKTEFKANNKPCMPKTHDHFHARNCVNS
ncbi:hypothetical protein G7K_1578-t1 [Saitoella complicata NRRL Y-17804]|uniref:Zinc finger PHD-type domain-containing protein n=1 Tax=Saitoella complicata (strain BCRC 22490 / CBS 7301 / JCM 7358 / NBRC 10748 / NRRL Y-17804) TaxID=698492 RepID=A0A0E9NDA5_SAICN|nr:hypothetical protein G7K_1578-t1 [Saitoella complicata NRRL Y-17804]